MENNNRRNFLKTGALAGAALLSTSAFSSVAGNKDIAGKSNSNALQNPKRRTLGSGKYAIEVPALGLGCMGMSYHRSFIPDRKAMINLIRKSADLGVNFFDTAEVYGTIYVIKVMEKQRFNLVRLLNNLMFPGII